MAKQGSLSDALPMGAWQRLRRSQATDPSSAANDLDGEPTHELRDDLAIAEWQKVRQQQMSEGHCEGPLGAKLRHNDLLLRRDDPPALLFESIVTPNDPSPSTTPVRARGVRFAPMSERQWEVEAAQAVQQQRRIRPKPPRSDNPVEDWSLGRVGRDGYGKWGENAPNAEGRLNDRLPPSLRGLDDPKCNQFVWDALTAGGAQPGRVDGGRIPVAKDWGDPTSRIAGYEPVHGAPRPGDVISDGHHVGIYSPLPNGRPGTISAASPYSGEAGWNGGVVHNDWGFRRGQGNITVWRAAPRQRK